MAKDKFLIDCRDNMAPCTHVEAGGHPGWEPQLFQARLRESIKDVKVSLRWNKRLKVLCACAHLDQDIPQPFYVFSLGDRTREPLCDHTMHKCLHVWRNKPTKKQLIKWDKDKRLRVKLELSDSVDEYLVLTRHEREKRVKRIANNTSGPAFSYPGQIRRHNPFWSPELR